MISVLTHLKLFFISRSLAMTSTGSVFPVAFCISGSCQCQIVLFYQQPGKLTSILMKTLCFYNLQSAKGSPFNSSTNLLITNSKFALCLLVVLCKRMELFNWLALQNRHCEFHIGFRIFMARLFKVSEISLNQDQKLTQTFVSSGTAARVLFNAVSISSGVPSKNLPQPGKRLLSQLYRAKCQTILTHRHGREYLQ